MAVATENAMTCDALHAPSHKVFVSVHLPPLNLDRPLTHSCSLYCGHTFSQKALHDQFVANLKTVVENNRRIPSEMRQPPYTSDALQHMRQKLIQWNPTCPTCHRRVPASPGEAKKLTELAKTIQELTGDLVPKGVDMNDDEPMESDLGRWEEFFTLRKA